LCKENSFKTENDYFIKNLENATNITHYQNKQNNSISNASGIYFRPVEYNSEGYSNNLIWNIAHIIVVQQMLVYKLSGLPMMISDEMVEKYKKGTKPEDIATQSEVDEIQLLLMETINQTESDLENKIFTNYQEYPTSAGLY
jgi:hypothetical protein